eukprot:TRINITY_DN16969_c0_g1_i1.p1 TRINITY_DN16969_c0_g1~~TRINITY_DN16969_c0_g1_i1.p1  ORF type:complete len:125 (+),score=36.61 TRINITY_DN16969_c0_g1_i1:214-588(+)
MLGAGEQHHVGERGDHGKKVDDGEGKGVRGWEGSVWICAQLEPGYTSSPCSHRRDSLRQRQGSGGQPGGGGGCEQWEEWKVMRWRGWEMELMRVKRVEMREMKRLRRILEVLIGKMQVWCLEPG